MNTRCAFGHRFEVIGSGNMLRVVDNKPSGTYIMSRYTVCGKIKRDRFK